jgi:multicomponent Na+:H+ antiporter subunit B
VENQAYGGRGGRPVRAHDEQGGRGRVLLNLFAALLLLGAGMLVYRAVTDTGDGVKLFDTPAHQRVSSSYIRKSVSGPVSEPVRIGSRGLEEGSANLVTSVVVGYRAFDTLLEVLVLFAAASGVGLLMVGRSRAGFREASPIVRSGIPLINLVVVVTGAVIILRGHLSPGGGFAGGAVVASGFILLALAFRQLRGRRLFAVLESLMGLAFLGVGLAGLFLEGSFLQSFLPPGRVGYALSSTTALLLYVLIGLKVFSEVAGISLHFLGKEGP